MPKFKMNKILLTGGAGYIGSHVCHLLIDQGHEVTCIDSLITGNKKLLPKKVKLEVFDIDEKEKVKNLINNNNFDLVMHFAGLIRVDESVEQPERYREFNYSKAKIFLETCFENGLKKVIFSSTAAVYGNPPSHKVKETDLTNPLNPYASSKLELENFIKKTSKQYNSNYVILRYFNVAGADEKMRTGLISKVSSHLIKVACEVVVGKRDKLIINGDDYATPDGTAIRDYIHVSDLADIHYKILKKISETNKSTIVNCGYFKGTSVKKVINEFKKQSKKKIDILYRGRRAGDLAMVIANNKKLKKFINWYPKYYRLSAIVKSCIQWEKNN